ncbi:MAG: M48 family metallopeptidase [Acidobacteriaceae bacterium]
MNLRLFRSISMVAYVLVLMLFTADFAAQAQGVQPATPAATNTVQQANSTTAAQKPAYSLPPEKLAEAIAYSHKQTVLFFVDTAWGILTLIVLLWLGLPARFRDWAVAASHRRWVQGFLFTPLLLLAISLFSLPLDLYGQHLQLAYHQSVQHWGSWWWDWTKSQFLSMVITSLLVLLLFWVIRKSPRRWWLWFWLATLPIMVFGMFIAPLVIDPMFNKFEPLQKTDPALVAQLEKVVKRGGIQIPPDRMFLMKASAKVTGINAYVTGFGASKRVVVWDTAIQRATPDEISFIFGHEMGHYVLGHIRSGLLFAAALTLVMIWLGFHTVHWLLRRFGPAWHITGVDDWAALAVLMLALSVFNFVSEPISNSFSRMHEHAADVYGQEAIHGIVPDPQKTAQQAFQMLGESYLEDPNPNAFIEFWTFSHPSVASRAAFAASYDPWVPGKHPKYFNK